MTRFIFTLLILTTLPISLSAQTICVYEIDTAFYYSVDGVDTVKNRILCIDTIPHWFMVPVQIPDTWPGLILYPRVDTVIVYIPDTVSLWHRHHADGTTETYDSWLVWPCTVYAGPWDDTIWVSLYAKPPCDGELDDTCGVEWLYGCFPRPYEVFGFDPSLILYYYEYYWYREGVPVPDKCFRTPLSRRICGETRRRKE
ncbi:MAG: hypothetical protein ABIH23_16880 [bacterium]